MTTDERYREIIDANKKLKLEISAQNLRLQELKKAWRVNDFNGYQRGLEDAWKIVRIIAGDPEYGCYTMIELNEIFGTSSVTHIFSKYTIGEVIGKIKDYENRKREESQIRVGDELAQIYGSGDLTGLTCIVTKYNHEDDRMVGIKPDGDMVVCGAYTQKYWRKTGRHFSEIVEFMEKLKDDNNI